MKNATIKGIAVGYTGLEEQELEAYVDKYLAEEPRMHSLRLECKNGEDVDVTIICHQRPFERIRRITGYLVGTTDRWNNAKRAELEDRVTHA